MLRLRSLPAGAKVTKAILVLTPVAPLNGKRFEETFVFNATVGANELNAEDWGVNKIPEAPGPFVEVDFHARRTLEAVSGSQGSIGNVLGTETPGASLQVDMGGSYVGIANDGTFMAPDKTPWVVTLSSGATPLPGLTVNKFRLSAVPLDPTNLENTTLDITNVTIRSVPTNVSMRIGQMAPFWTRLGELINAETSSDFADVLQAFLSEAEVENGFFIIPLVIHSDTIARLNVELQIEYVLEQPVLPPHLPEVTIPYNFSTVPGVDEALTTVSLPREAIPVSGRTGAQVRGEFEPTRVASGPIGEEPTTFPIVVSPKCALAQPLRSDTEIAITGIDLPLANTQPGLAGLDVAIQSDADGKPSGEILTSADVRIKKPLPDQSAWGSATLPSEFRVLPEVRYWLVLQSQVGQAYWNATPGTTGELALQCSRDGGLSWRMATEPGVTAPLAALFRLRDTPDRFTVPVQLQIGKGAHAVRRRLDEFAPLGRVEFSFDLAEKLEEYLAGPAVVSPCGTGELLTNRTFDQPPHDDATRRLFGFDAGGAWVLIGSVDLSRGANLAVERFIHLSVDGKLPIRIDCAGANPSHTNFNEIIDAINRAVGDEVASEYTINKKIHTGRLRIESSSGDGGRFELHPWRQAIVPQGWECSPEARGQIWRLKLPTITYSLPGAESPVTWRPERIVVAMEASGDKPLMVIQSLPVAEGCAYALRFLFRTCVDFRRRPASTGPNPRIEQDVTFEVYDSPQAQTHIQDSGRGIQGLNCGDELEISLSLASPFVELTLTTDECPKVEVEAFEGDMSVGTTKMSGDGRIPQTLRLTGTRITRVVVSGASGETLLHKFCFADRSLWEIRWIDAEGQLIKSEAEELDTRDQFFPEIDGMLQREVRLVAPSGAAQAEIRFIQPPLGFLLLDDVSLRPTSEALSNASFQQWEVETGDQLSPVGWTRLSGWLDHEVEEETRLSGIMLRSDGPEDAIIAQTMEIVAGERYEVRVCAHPAPSLTTVSQWAGNPEGQPIQQRARLELRWLDDRLLGDPVILPMDGRGFPSYAWAGTAPAGATRAEIRLIQPRSRGSLLVEYVSLERADLVSVPLIFLGEAPGELTVSDLRVTYDLPEPPEQALPVTVAAAEVSPVVTATRPLTLPDAAIGIVAGVGERFLSILNSQPTPITTIADLATLDPEIKIKGIPRERRLELKTAAEMIMALHVEVATFVKLADEPLETLMTLRPADLSRRSGQRPEQAAQLQRNLRALRLLIKNDDFRSLRLSDLMPGRL
jgi:hypothetical protein